LSIPVLPITIMGTAVAFYLGFKNNSAYDRAWEARKIWGAIVNSSRTWGIMVKDFVTDEYAKDAISEKELKEIHRRLIYRHIAWLYRLKRQLRAPKVWEHAYDREHEHQFRKLLKEQFPLESEEVELANFLADEEVQELLKMKNVATQLLARQSADLRMLKRRGLIDDFRHMELENMLKDFYTQQGKCERIKNYPLPRQYATVSVYFVVVFIGLLPMGILTASKGLPEYMIWGTIPFSMIVGWVFWLMEMVGDYAENPFENLAFDTPMYSLTRTIEIDLREMLGETELPAPIGPINDIVM
ncbi:MAG: bestrophin family ion channel, partial [Bacteroidota bacterium]